MRVTILSYLYPSSPEKLQAGVSHKVGRARVMKKRGGGGGKKKKKERKMWSGSSSEEKLKADFLNARERVCKHIHAGIENS